MDLKTIVMNKLSNSGIHKYPMVYSQSLDYNVPIPSSHASLYPLTTTNNNNSNNTMLSRSLTSLPPSMSNTTSNKSSMRGGLMRSDSATSTDSLSFNHLEFQHAHHTVMPIPNPMHHENQKYNEGELLAEWDRSNPTNGSATAAESMHGSGVAALRHPHPYPYLASVSSGSASSFIIDDDMTDSMSVRSNSLLSTKTAQLHQLIGGSTSGQQQQQLNNNNNYNSNYNNYNSYNNNSNSNGNGNSGNYSGGLAHNPILLSSSTAKKTNIISSNTHANNYTSNSNNNANSMKGSSKGGEDIYTKARQGSSSMGIGIGIGPEASMDGSVSTVLTSSQMMTMVPPGTGTGTRWKASADPIATPNSQKKTLRPLPPTSSSFSVQSNSQQQQQRDNNSNNSNSATLKRIQKELLS